MPNDTDTSEGGQAEGPAPGGSNMSNELFLNALAPLLTGNSPPDHIVLSDELSRAENWKLWKQQWDLYVITSHLSERSTEEFRVATFLKSIGPDGLKIYNAWEKAEEEAETVTTLKKMFENELIGEINQTYVRYKFNTRRQETGESFASYLNALRALSKTCGFCKCLGDSLLRDRIVTGIRKDVLQRRLLQERKLDLKRCIDMCTAAEATETHVKEIGRTSTEEIHKITEKKRSSGKYPNQHKTEKHEKKKECHFCGKQHPFMKTKCPAWGKICQKCKGKNHFSVVCRAGKKRINAVAFGWEPDQEEDAESYDPTYEPITSVGAEVNGVKTSNKTLLYAEMVVKGKPTKFQLDSGAAVNLINKKLVDENDIIPTQKTLVMWNQAETKPVGEAMVKIHNPKNKTYYDVNFVVVNETLMPILGAVAVQKMQLIRVNTENFHQVAAVKTNNVIEEYADVFNEDLGLLPGETNFQLDEDVKPVISPRHQTPIALRPKLKECLDKMVADNVLSPVEEPTDWLSNIVVAKKKNGDLRICLDPKNLNLALKREHYQLPVLDDILPELSQAKIFTSFDLKAGYWHVKLDEASSKLTTFSTPFGRYKWKRLPFGVNVASEIFQKRLYQAIGDLPGVLCIADDILLYGAGNTEEEARSDHDIKLKKLLQRCREVGVRLNRDKMKLQQKTVKFIGHILTTQGLKPDPEKIEAIKDMPRPEDVAGVQRLGGFVNYLAKFLPKISDVMSPIRQLTRKDVPWNWADAQEAAFNEVKRLVSEAPILRYYDATKRLTIQCDSSQSGLGAALLQEGQPIAFASRSLTDTETRYAQIEKELLAIVFACEKFHQYVYGNHVTVLSDHRPLETILKKPLANAPRRLQGMAMRLQKYDVTIEYLKGKLMYLADTLSRAYLPTSTETGPQDGIEEVNMMQYLPISKDRLAAIKTATENDYACRALKEVILEGWPESKQDMAPEVTPYFAYRDEMTVIDGIILRGERVVIPRDMRKTMKEKIHSSHLGITGCFRRARECLYWPNMAADIKDYISSCAICREVETKNSKETLMSHDIPDRPWSKVGTDLFSLRGKKGSREDYLITVDYFSNFFEVDRLYDTTAKSVISKLKQHFARYGLPEVVVSDNGPQYACEEFASFARKWDFEHRPSSPGNSQANGKAESAVKTAKALIKKAKKAGSDPLMAILDHRNTPPANMDSPAQRSFGRRTRTLLPMTKNLLQPKKIECEINKKQIQGQQEKQQIYYNNGAKDLKPLEEGDVVRLHPFVRDQVWKKGKVLKRLDERSYDIQTENGVLRRNRVHVKKTNENDVLCTPNKPVPAAPLSPRSKQNNKKLASTPAQPRQQVKLVQEPPATSPPPVVLPSKPAVQEPSCQRSPIKTSRSGRSVKPTNLKWRYQE
jgi:hypothetical protein